MSKSKYGDPLWCEDCELFEGNGLDGEGECKAIHPHNDVWYAHPACADFKPKEEF